MESDSMKSHVTLKVGDKEFSCRRELLCSNSPYFKAMFSSNFIERDKDIVEIQGAESDAMGFVLEALEPNQGTDLLKATDILSVLQAASMFQFDTIQEKVVNLIINHRLTIDTCLQTVIAADELQILNLYHKAKALALWEFSRVKKTSTYFELPVNLLEEYLKHDGLHVTQGEFEVFDAALSWLQDETRERSCHLEAILGCIRFKEINLSDIRTMFFYPAIMENDDATNLLQCILDMKEARPIRRLHSEQPISVVFSPPEDLSLLRESQSRQSSTNGSESECCGLNCCSYFTSPLRQSRTSNRLGSSTTCSCCKHSSAGSRRSSSESCDKSPVSAKRVSSTSSNSRRYYSRTIEMAKKLLSVPRRSLPVVPCVIGHNVEMSLSTRAKRKFSSSGKPYAIYYDKMKAQLIPFLHLAKIDEGPVEPTGYKVIVRGQDLYIVGGEYLLGHGNWNKSIWHYNLLSESWSFETSLPFPRRHMSVCSLGDELFIIGGFGRHRVITNTVERYDTENKTWNRCASLPANLYGVACVGHMGKVFVFGPQVYFYRHEIDTWDILCEPRLPHNKVFNCAVSYKNAIYLTGEYSTEMIRFVPQMISNISAEPAQCVGNFQHFAVNMCLVGDEIYSFSTDDDNNMYVEVYNIPKKEFHIVWQSSGDRDNVGDFSAKCCIGCFPIIKY